MIFLKYNLYALNGSYTDDIVVIILQSNVTFSAVVSSVGMHWKNYENMRLKIELLER